MFAYFHVLHLIFFNHNQSVEIQWFIFVNRKLILVRIRFRHFLLKMSGEIMDEIYKKCMVFTGNLVASFLLNTRIFIIPFVNLDNAAVMAF